MEQNKRVYCSLSVMWWDALRTFLQVNLWKAVVVNYVSVKWIPLPFLKMTVPPGQLLGSDLSKKKTKEDTFFLSLFVTPNSCNIRFYFALLYYFYHILCEFLLLFLFVLFILFVNTSYVLLYFDFTSYFILLIEH